ncbi:class I SAM-dependent methyltransferase [Streptomyces sp. NPDC004065]|uniref:class I SAM-dependent methyltransferase n=1 Tax=Streptomyces sp. NPDC004065 TaxID=3364689 RepID=UPI00384C0FDB
MFSPEGPTLRELAVQALSSVQHGYDLLAPKFDRTPFRTPDPVLEAVAAALERIGPFEDGLDLCCGTGAGLGVLARVCRSTVTGVDFSAGMLAVAREHAWNAVEHAPDAREHALDAREHAPDARGHAAGQAPGEGRPTAAWVRGDARALPFTAAFDLVVTFGALGHFLPRELPALFGQVHSVLRPGGVFAFPVLAPPGPRSRAFWTLLGFDAVMRVRNALWRPPFVMYYRAFRFGDVRRELERAGFHVEHHALPEFGRRDDGSPRARVIVARGLPRATAPGRPGAAAPSPLSPRPAP